MLQEFDQLSSSNEEKKSNQNEKQSSNLDFSGKNLNMNEFQTLLQTAQTLLQKNKIKEAVKLYENSKNNKFSAYSFIIRSPSSRNFDEPRRI